MRNVTENSSSVGDIRDRARPEEHSSQGTSRTHPWKHLLNSGTI